MKRVGCLLMVVACAAACAPSSPPQTTTSTTAVESPDPALNVTLLAESGTSTEPDQTAEFPVIDTSDISRVGLHVQKTGACDAAVAKLYGVFDVEVDGQVEPLRVQILSMDTRFDPPAVYFGGPLPPRVQVTVTSGAACEFRVALWGSRT